MDEEQALNQMLDYLRRIALALETLVDVATREVSLSDEDD
jgi:hypothetical protein